LKKVLILFEKVAILFGKVAILFEKSFAQPHVVSNLDDNLSSN